MFSNKLFSLRYMAALDMSWFWILESSIWAKHLCLWQPGRLMHQVWAAPDKRVGDCQGWQFAGNRILKRMSMCQRESYLTRGCSDRGELFSCGGNRDSRLVGKESWLPCLISKTKVNLWCPWRLNRPITHKEAFWVLYHLIAEFAVFLQSKVVYLMWSKPPKRSQPFSRSQLHLTKPNRPTTILATSPSQRH